MFISQQPGTVQYGNQQVMSAQSEFVSFVDVTHWSDELIIDFDVLCCDWIDLICFLHTLEMISLL
jgi:hypothetical protein